MTLRTVLLSLQALLSAAEPDDPQDAVVARQYKEAPELFRQTAKHWTFIYAGITTIILITIYILITINFGLLLHHTANSFQVIVVYVSNELILVLQYIICTAHYSEFRKQHLSKKSR